MKPCPICNSAVGVREYIYGMPSEEPDSSRFVLGGCCEWEDAPDYKCITCATDFYRDNDQFHNKFISDGSGIDFQCRKCQEWIPTISELDWHECSSEVGQ